MTMTNAKQTNWRDDNAWQASESRLCDEGGGACGLTLCVQTRLSHKFLEFMADKPGSQASLFDNYLDPALVEQFAKQYKNTSAWFTDEVVKRKQDSLRKELTSVANPYARLFEQVQVRLRAA